MNLRKKIFFFVSSLERPGGIERIASFIMSALAIRGYEVTVLTLGGTSLFFELSPLVMVRSLVYKPIPFYKKYIYAIIQLCKILRKEKPDIFISVGASLCLYSFIPCFFYQPKYFLWEHFNTNYKWNKYTTNLSRRLATLFCDLIIVLTKEDEVYYKKRRAKGVVIVPNPVAITRDNEEITRKEHIILAVGRLVSVKGFDLLLKAWMLIPDKKSWKLYIVGEGEQKDYLESLIALYEIEDSSFILPATNDISSFYSKASIYALSSLSECFPLVLLEAEYFGLPIVAYNCGEGVQTLVKNEHNGFVIPLVDVSMYSLKLQQLMFDDEMRESFGLNSINKAKEYSIDNIIDKWAALF